MLRGRTGCRAGGGAELGFDHASQVRHAFKLQLLQLVVLHLVFVANLIRRILPWPSPTTQPLFGLGVLLLAELLFSLGFLFQRQLRCGGR